MVNTTASRFKGRKGQVFSSDAFIAAGLVLLMLYFGFSSFATLSMRAADAEAGNARLGRALAFADYLMKAGLVHKERSELGDLSYSHVLEMGKLTTVQHAGFVVELGAMCAPLPNQTCVCRPAIIWESNEVGYLEVCAEQ